MSNPVDLSICIGWVSPKHRDLGPVIPFSVNGVTCAARAENRWNAPVDSAPAASVLPGLEAQRSWRKS